MPGATIGHPCFSEVSMSPTIFAIAAVPAAIVYLVGFWSKNKARTIIVAVAMGLLGIFSGAPSYMVTDLFFVGVAYLLTTPNFASSTAKPAAATPTRVEVMPVFSNAGKEANEASTGMHVFVAAYVILWVIVFVIVWYNGLE